MKQTELLISNFVITGIRVLAFILIGFFLTRILVNQLGLELFGLFTTLGASGMLLTMFTNILQLSIARELGIRVGESDSNKLQIAFSSSFYIQLISGILVFFAGFLFSHVIVDTLTIPVGYEKTTRICLILTFIQFSIGIVTSTYGGILRAHQHLKTIAYLQLANKILVFISAILLIYWKTDKLVFFVVMNLVAFIILQLATALIAIKRFPQARPLMNLFCWDTTKSIFRYASLALIGGIGGQIRRNGVSVILNVYFGNIVTAANGIGIRLSNLVAQFVGLISPVIQPAMNANTGSGNKTYIERLIPLSSIIGIAVVFPIVIPLVFETKTILHFWLRTELPENAVLFSQLLVVSLVVTMISKGHAMALHANGNIGWLTFINQTLVIAGITIASMYACSKLTNPWLLPVGELIGLILATSFWQPFWVSKKLNLSVSSWFRYTLLPSFLILSLNLIMVYVVFLFLAPGLVRAVILGFLSCLICFTVLWYLGFDQSDRTLLKQYIQTKLT